VTFNATGSSDPDAGNTLTYFWDFGDGTPETSTASLTINHVYAANGNYTARLRARDDNFAFSNPVTILIQAGNTPPVPSINTPTPATLFSVGQAITLNGSATDPQQGPLPASALSWRVWLHHAAHEHPFLGPMGGNNVPFNAPAPEDLLAATNSYLRIELTATDAGGLSQTISQDLDPRAVNLTFNTVPAGLGLTVNLINPITGPQTIVSWANWALDVRAATQNDAGGRTWALRNWSDGLPARHTLVTPSTNATYTATFRPPKGDADSDGRVDLFFRNLGTNRHLAWLMNGVTRSSESFLSPDPANANWAAVGADDFNSDDRNDFVFSNGATGAVEFWLMNGATRVGGAVPLTGSPPPGLDWKLSATGDFNHDGRPDLVWRNVATRKIAVWTLNGTAYTATLVPNPDSAADANWEIAAGLDYNGDGLRDWLWYNVTSGKLVLWFLDANLQRTAGQFTNPPSAADANWRVLGGGDYGQGPGGVAFSNDVVWRNSTSGRLVVWYLDFAGNRTAGTFTNPVGPTAGASTPLDWTVVGPR
jgi:hypothetical protein